jgi:hypothetical protein
MFWKSNVKLVKEQSLIILNKLGHKFSGDWVPVRHSPHNNYHLTHPNEDCLIDALSIDCIVPDCKMTFDINSLPQNNQAGAETYLLWHGCAHIASFMLQPINDLIVYPTKGVEQYVVCKKFQVMI